ncbi:hypothetical protein M3204_07020 [Mesobacillus subterraneus]|uniref:hypothetical protein n=1 Tax=Mesobacillus subterraneus TaxID=285983 RepID=UPI00203C1050|nr:hypothetical protein [Mesobacillus subterraneus]MCM3664148.1 hypothetical protein [Mesobacillus subterraneus]MCM3682176.1 hypothetical protein [Mesobacillus subterraneus]
MNNNQRSYIVADGAKNSGNKSNSNTTLGNFEIKPPNNTGTILGIIGGVLTTVGDALATIGAIIQLNTDVSVDLQSQVDDFKSDQEKDIMREEIDDLQEKVKQLEKLIKSNQY